MDEPYLMEGLYIVFEGCDCTVFRKKEDIIHRLETWDIVNNEYEVFDIQGYRLRFVFNDDELARLFSDRKWGFVDATRRGVVIDLTRSDTEPQADEVTNRIKKFLELVGYNSSRSGEDSLEGLVEQLVMRFGITEQN